LLRHSDEVPFLTSEKLNEIAEEEVMKGQRADQSGQGDENAGNELKNSQENIDVPKIDSIDAVLRYTLTSKLHSVLLAKGYFIFEN